MKTQIKISIYSIIATIMLSYGLTSCSKTEDTLSGTGSISVEFDNQANGSTLVLGDNYTDEKGEVMKFSMFNYFVSNFSLVKADGTIFTLPKDSCYFLIKESGGANTEIVMNNIPAGDYTELRFIVGVDSAKSAAPISERMNDLDPAGNAAGMYWMWNSGYIFVKAEGTSPQAPLDTATSSNKFRYHIGLFGGYSSPTINNIKTIQLKSTEVATVRTNIKPNFHVTVDIMEMFKTPTTISVAANPTVMVTPFSANVANNYADMFKIHHVHN